MLAREAVRDAKNIIRWNVARELLQDALDYGMQNLAELQEAGYLEDDNGTVVGMGQWDDTIESSLFVGTVFSLTPSGKYYLPFACGNVESCPRCKGTGQTKNGKHCTWCDGMGSREAYLDELWYTALHEKAESEGLFIFSGEGDPCDIFVGMGQLLD